MPFSHIIIWKLNKESMKYVIFYNLISLWSIIFDQLNFFESFGKRCSDLCLDNELPSQPEVDKVLVLMASRVACDSCSTTFDTLGADMFGLSDFFLLHPHEN